MSSDSGLPTRNVRHLSLDVSDDKSTRNDREETPVAAPAATNIGLDRPSAAVGGEKTIQNVTTDRILLGATAPVPAAPSGVFKVPKKKLVSENKLDTASTRLASPTGHLTDHVSPVGTTALTPVLPTVNSAVSGSTPSLAATVSVPPSPATQLSILNKQIISNLNKSLKAKQKIISAKEPHPKNLTIISEMLNTLPQLAVFPNNVSGNAVSGTSDSVSLAHADTDDDHDHDSTLTAPIAAAEPPKPPQQPPQQQQQLQQLRPKHKRIAKQNSTRTDFFAAKLASAVDDVESSDSDETFVYETNNNDYENDSNAVLTSHHDNVLVAGSMGPSANADFAPTPAVHLPLIPEVVRNDPLDMSASRADSIHLVSLRDMVTPPSTTRAAVSDDFPNPYTEKRPYARREGSSYSARDDPRLQLPLSLDNNINTLRTTTGSVSNLPLGHFPGTTANGGAYGPEFPPHARSVSEYPDERYSYNDVDDELDDDLSDEYYGPENGGGDTKNEDSAALAPPKGPKKAYKSLTTALSKLRSTTSKLFDKKGLQPRRYSIIPDDIDIEDFDDELIYYDNNIRFPYNSTNGTSDNLYNENTPLTAHGHRMPHYRLLNLNFPGAKRPLNHLKGKRYLSMSQPYPSQGNNPKSDIFPFPYPDNQNYYYDLDEYDEEADKNGARGPPSHLLPSQGRFFLPRKTSKSNSLRAQRLRYIKSFMYTLVSILVILAIGFILGFVLASTKDLSNVSIVSIDNPVVSQDELVFSVVVEAFNPGWFTVSIENVELDIFAKSGYLTDNYNRMEVEGVETVLLGSVYELELALEFEGGFFRKDAIQQTGEIKLVSPGKNLTNVVSAAQDAKIPLEDNVLIESGSSNSSEPDNSKKWEVISKNPFDLILRGVLKYDLPMTKNTKSVVVNKVAYVDPTVG